MPTPLVQLKNALGMHPSTAKSRLNKDIIYEFVVKANGRTCYHCDGEIQREELSIEHMTPWLSSDNPGVSFFDMNNIAFSHNQCNSQASSGGGAPRKYNSARQRKRAADRRHYEKHKEKIRARHKANRSRPPTVTVQEILSENTN